MDSVGNNLLQCFFLSLIFLNATPTQHCLVLTVSPLPSLVVALNLLLQAGQSDLSLRSTNYTDFPLRDTLHHCSHFLATHTQTHPYMSSSDQCKRCYLHAVSLTLNIRL